nr:MAG TPA: hypothetical protein [Bacteriophage sp.]
MENEICHSRKKTLEKMKIWEYFSKLPTRQPYVIMLKQLQILLTKPEHKVFAQVKIPVIPSI